MLTLPLARTAALAAAVALAAGTPEPLPAQEAERFLPERAYLPRLYAGFREPITATKLVFVTQSPHLFGEVLEGEADLGAALPIYLLAGQSLEDGLAFGVEAGVFTRFNMETKEKDLIASDWMFAVPFVLHRGDSWVRFRYFHTSAHLGDEYIKRFEVERGDFTRDELELLGYLRVLQSLSFYAGGGWAFRTDPVDSEQLNLRGGVQLEGEELNGVRFYGAVDAQLDQDDDWEPQLTIHGGLRMFGADQARGIRLVTELFTGPSWQGQFCTGHTTYFSLGVVLDL